MNRPTRTESLPLALVLELGHAPQFAHGGRALEQPREPSVLGHVALDEEGAAVGVEAGGQEVESRFVGPGPELGRVDVEGQGVQVDDAVEAVVHVLVGHPVAHRPEVVAQMQLTARLQSGQNAGHGRPS